MDKYLLAVDEGTSSTRAIIFDSKGHKISQSQLSFQQYFPQPGWVEHDLDEIWQKTEQVIRQAIEQAELSVKQILAIGITNQRETSCFWDKRSGRPIGRALVWQDRRTHEYCQMLRQAGHEPTIQAKTGLILDPYFSASKIHWVLRHRPEAAQLAACNQLCFGTIETFLLWKMTRGKSFFTDITNASRTSLLNIHQLAWDAELLALYQIPEAILPTVQDNVSEFGYYQADWMDTAIPITAMIGDQQSATVGQACLHPGMMKSTYGTGCFLMMHAGTTCPISTHRLLSTLLYRLPGQAACYGLEGSLFVAGSLIQWLEQMHVLTDPADSVRLAASVTDSEGIMVVPSLTGLGAPYWNPHARGAILGLTRQTNPAHLVRAALEAIGFQTKEIVELMALDSQIPIKTLQVDGGMAENTWLLQWLADCLNIPVKKPKLIETTSIGAAFLAGLGIGVYSTLSEIEQFHQTMQTYDPIQPQAVIDRSYQRWKKAVACVNQMSEA